MNSINLLNKVSSFKNSRMLAKNKKADVLLRAENATGFYIKQKAVSGLSLVGNIGALEGFAVGVASLSQDFKNIAAPIFFGGAAILRNACISQHKDAIKEAAQVCEKLVQKGFSKEETKLVANKIVSRNGNLIYSNLFRALFPKRMQKISQGIETRSGFLHFTRGRVSSARDLATSNN
jgi:hypothetical protein